MKVWYELLRHAKARLTKTEVQQKEGNMKKSLMYLLVVACAIFQLVGCGGGGDGGGDGSSSIGDDGTGPLTAEEAEVVTMAITHVAHAVSQSINGVSAQTTYKTLKALKETGDFSFGVSDGDGGVCDLRGSGTSDLDSDPMTFSISGFIDCGYTTTVSTSQGDVEVTINDGITVTMSGTLSKDHSSVELSFVLNEEHVNVYIDGVRHQVGVNYSLSIVGSGGEMTVTEEGTIGSQSVSQTRTITYAYTTGVYDFFTDNWVIYVDPSLYLGEYSKDESVNPDTCSNSVFFGYWWSNALDVTALSGTSVSGTLLGDAVSRDYAYDAAYPHFEDSDALKYWYVDPGYTCIVIVGSLPSVAGDGYSDHLNVACSDGVDGCGVEYSRENADSLRTVKSVARGVTYVNVLRERASELQAEVKEMVNNL